MDRVGLIYSITNKLNGKMYVGKTTLSQNRRWQEHLHRAKSGSRQYIHRALMKHGFHSFEIKTLLVTDKDSLNYYEKELIRIFGARIFGYNLTDGGEGTTGYKHEKPSWNKGLPGHRTEESILKQIQTMKTKYPNGTNPRGNPWPKGKRRSEETKEKIREAHKGLRHSAETRKKMSETRKNCSNEYRKRMSETITAWWAERREALNAITQ